MAKKKVEKVEITESAPKEIKVLFGDKESLSISSSKIEAVNLKGGVGDSFLVLELSEPIKNIKIK